MNRREFLALAGLAGVAVASGLTGCQQPQGTTSEKAITLGLTYIPNVQFSPAYVADQKKLWPAPVNLRHHGQQEGLFQALVAGQEDFVIAGADEAMVAMAQGQDLRVIAAFYAKYPAELITLKSSGIAKTADLKGKKLGVPGRYGESWYSALALLADSHLSEKDVTIVEIGYTAQAALQTGKVDALIGFANNDAVQMKLAGMDIVELPLAEKVPLVSACLVTSGKTFTNGAEPNARKIAAGLIAGIQQVRKDPQYALEVTEKYLPTPFDEKTRAAAQATLTATIPYFTDDGSLDAAAFDAMSAFLLANNIITKEVPSSSILKPAI